MKNIEVSTIIPVYNAESFIERAVDSALQHDIVKEVILIDDGSTDGSGDICVKLKEKHPRVLFYQHADGENRGAGATRNLGIKNASSEYLSFLDVDDIYLPNRFDKDIEVLLNFPDADGVINALGIEVIDEDAKRAFDQVKGLKELTTISGYVEPEELAYVIYDLHPRVKGYFSLMGLTVKREVARSVGYFNEDLRLHQDTEWIFRLMVQSRLHCGEISKPTALRGVHLNNRIYRDMSLSSRDKLYVSTYSAIKNLDIPRIFKLRIKLLIPYKRIRGGRVTLKNLWDFVTVLIPYMKEKLKYRVSRN